jgi:predicted O-methyltransferase YrrM
MRRKFNIGFFFMAFMLFLGPFINPALSEEAKKDSDLDEKVRKFLESHRDRWVDWNVPEVDGKILYDLIIKHNYKKAVEIGTSTGHSAIWIAWALSKTGGKLITIEIDEGRYKEALANFMEAGLSDYIDAQLADAHELVKELKGPFDFVFSDADKDWYKNYFIALAPKLEVGGCFTAHNASGGYSGIREFLEYVQSLPNFETMINRSSPAGISISYKKTEK